MLVLAVSAFCLTAVISSGKMPEAWNINEHVHPLLKQYIANKSPRVINAESLPALRKARTVPEESLPKNDRVSVRNEF